MLRRLIILLATGLVLAAGAVLIIPGWRDRAESIPMRIEAWWHDLQPRDPFVPPPRDVLPAGATEVRRMSSAATIAAGDAEQSASATSVPQVARPAPTATRTATTPSPTPPPPPAEMRLTKFRHEYQGWNNCGPVTVGMLLSHYGLADTQKEIAPVLKPNPKDQNVAPGEMAAYIRSKAGLEALVAVNGDLTMLKRLIANDLPVIIETWFTPKPNDGMGHYRLLFAYSDQAQQFTALDSYNGPNVRVEYQELDENWKAFNRLYIVGYRKEQEALVRSLTGHTDAETMWQNAVARAREEIASNADDAFAWFNLGGAVSHLGRQREASEAFDRARRVGVPWRMLWYQHEIYDAYLATGRAEEALDLANLTIRQAPELEEARYYRGLALEALGQAAEAAKAYREALRLNPNYIPAATALARMGG